MSEKVFVPKDVIPYLHRIHTNAFLEKNEVQGHRCAKILNLPGFDYFMGGIIIMNLIVMIIETDRTAVEEESSTGVVHWTEWFGWVVLAIFIFELSARLLVFHCTFWQDPWNVFDFIVVVVDTFFSLAGLIGGNSFPVSVLRIFRLAKLARAFKVLRVFPELRLMLAGLVSSISAIIWGTLLLFFCMLVWSLVAVLFIHPLNKNIAYDNCERCPRAYDSVMSSTMTFSQQIVAGDSWGQATIPIIEKHPYTAPFFIMVYLSIGMALTNLILGVVVNVAQKAQDKLDLEDKAEKAFLKLQTHTNLLEMCKVMDSNNNGQLTHEQITAAFEEPGEFRESIVALDITKDDFDIVWGILDPDRRGSVSYKELVRFLSTMKVSDTQFMLAYIKYYINLLRHAIMDKMENQFSEEEQLERKVEESLDKIEEKENELLNDDNLLLGRAEAVIAAVGVPCDLLGENASQAKDVSEICKSDNDIPKALAPMKRSLQRLQNVADESQVWLKQVRDDTSVLRCELANLLTDLNRDLAARMAPGSSMSTQKQPDLLVAAPRNLLSESSWKSVATEGNVLKIPHPEQSLPKLTSVVRL